MLARRAFASAGRRRTRSGFPGVPEDSEITPIIVSPLGAEYWDNRRNAREKSGMDQRTKTDLQKLCDYTHNFQLLFQWAARHPCAVHLGALPEAAKYIEAPYKRNQRRLPVSGCTTAEASLFP